MPLTREPSSLGQGNALGGEMNESTGKVVKPDGSKVPSPKVAKEMTKKTSNKPNHGGKLHGSESERSRAHRDAGVSSPSARRGDGVDTVTTTKANVKQPKGKFSPRDKRTQGSDSDLKKSSQPQGSQRDHVQKFCQAAESGNEVPLDFKSKPQKKEMRVDAFLPCPDSFYQKCVAKHYHKKKTYTMKATGAARRHLEKNRFDANPKDLVPCYLPSGMCQDIHYACSTCVTKYGEGQSESSLLNVQLRMKKFEKDIKDDKNNSVVVDDDVKCETKSSNEEQLNSEADRKDIDLPTELPVPFPPKTAVINEETLAKIIALDFDKDDNLSLELPPNSYVEESLEFIVQEDEDVEYSNEFRSSDKEMETAFDATLSKVNELLNYALDRNLMSLEYLLAFYDSGLNPEPPFDDENEWDDLGYDVFQFMVDKGEIICTLGEYNEVIEVVRVKWEMSELDPSKHGIS